MERDFSQRGIKTQSQPDKSTDISLTVQEKHYFFVVQGEMTTRMAAKFRIYLDEQWPAEMASVWFDITRVKNLDSGATALILEAQRRAQAQSAICGVVGATGEADALLMSAGFYKLVPMVKTVEEAIKYTEKTSKSIKSATSSVPTAAPWWRKFLGG